MARARAPRVTAIAPRGSRSVSRSAPAGILRRSAPSRRASRSRRAPQRHACRASAGIPRDALKPGRGKGRDARMRIGSISAGPRSRRGPRRRRGDSSPAGGSRRPAHDYDGDAPAMVGLVRDLESETGRRGTVGVGMPGALSPATGLVKNANSTWLIGQPLDRDLSGSPRAAGRASRTTRTASPSPRRSTARRRGRASSSA